ncbi:DnaJ family domain-containing protein [Cryobacterium tepidiphilum]|uniref:DUF1992 domain-containing protein n=1 Tax=Cryobacterium tepidiphilum TaxID=2486026 RepID=A0A3M8LGG1_9MICO|nr:DUF1992 domain-containing protein [Cryobacterium tepidiphilum]RNE63812.1 DUF1992 domain-containing protein [Cryobacterium tepidiphilum]
MSRKKGHSDARLNAARYRVDRLSPADDAANEPPAQDDATGQPTMTERAQYVEVLIQQAIRRGEFDDLPGAGKPLSGLQQSYDPDWWIRQKIEREKITGLGPPALTLRTEDAALDARLDEAGSETAVRGILEDFNQRVIEARRQLLGGPPVITPTRDVEEELARWRERRAARQRERDEQRQREQAAYDAMSWRERRRAKRGR